MNICLIRPPKLKVEGTLTPPANPPLGMAFIAGALQAAGHRVTAIDGIADAMEQFQINSVDFPVNSNKIPEGYRLVTLGLTPEQILERIPANTDIIGFSCMFTSNWLADRHLIKFLGEKLPHVTFIAGGESITGLAEVCMREAGPLQACVLGEGEETVVDLVDAIASKRPLDTVKGILYRQGDNFVKTVKRTRVKNIDEIPAPAWDLFDIDRYEKIQLPWWPTGRKTLPLLATRGCPYSCTFCTSPDMWGLRYYMRKPELVANEIELYVKKYGVTNFDLCDLTAIIKKEWFLEFAKIIIERKLDITWRIPAGTRSEAIDGEVARHLYLSGCWHIVYAPESGSKRMLKTIKKQIKVPNMLQSMRYAYNEKMYVFINMILGLPDERHSDIWKTVWFLVKCSWVGIHDMHFHKFRPYPGSVLFNRLLKENKITLNDDDYYVETTFTIESSLESSYYNDNISTGSYKFYNLFILAVFHGSNFLFRPNRLYKAVKNIVTNRPESRLEWKFASFLKQSVASLKGGLAKA